MTIGDQVRRIEPSDQVVFDSDGNVVGLKSGKSSGLEGRMLLPTTADAVQAKVSGGGISAKRRIGLAGDSFTEINDGLGYNPSASPSLHTAIRNLRVSLTASTGGTATLQHDIDGGRMRFASFGADYSAWTDVSIGGRYTLTDSLGVTCDLSLNARLYSGSGTTEYALTMASASWRSGTGALRAALEARYPGRFEFVPLGVSGYQTADVYASRTQIVAADVDAVIDHSGTNDVAGAEMTGAEIAASRTLNWDYWTALNMPVIAGMICPRFATGASDAASYSTTLRDVLATANALMADAAAARTGVHLVDTWSGAVDATTATGEARSGWTSDGVHPSGALVDMLAQRYGAVLDRLFPAPALQVAPISSGNDYSATKTRGNLVTLGRGGFQGTGGTAGTGISVAAAWSSGATAATSGVTVVISNGRAYLARDTGTAGTVAPSHHVGVASDGVVQWECISAGAASVGLAAAMSAARYSGAALLASAWKETSTDGGADWQAFYVNSAAAADESFRIYPTATLTNANFAAGSTISGQCEWDITELSPAACAGVALEVTTTGGPTSCVYGSQALTSHRAGLRGRVTPQLRPLVWPASITAVTFRLLTSSNIGGQFVARMRNMVLSRA